MKIGKIGDVNYRSLGVSEKIPFGKNTTPVFVIKDSDKGDEILFSQNKKAKAKENLPEFGVLLTSIMVGGIILYGLFGGKQL